MQHVFLLLLFSGSLIGAACSSVQEFASTDVSEVLQDEVVEQESNDETPIEMADTVVIGSQVWMTVNLNTLTFRNGDTIFQAKSNAEWTSAAKSKTPAWCYLNNDSANGEKHGKLYNYWAVVDKRGLAPDGWRIPGDEDFAILLQEIGASNGDKLKSTSGWENGGNGSNSSGFRAEASGYRNATGLFNPMGRLTCWWTSTEKSSGSSWGYKLVAADNNFKQDDFYKQSGLSVRCIK